MFFNEPIFSRIINILIYFECIVFIFLVNNFNKVQSFRVISTFSAKSQINNILLLNDRIIVGAVNSLYSVDIKNLSEIQQTLTGPIIDSPLCNSELSSCVGIGKQLIKETNNVNKILQFVPAVTNFFGKPNSAKKIKPNNVDTTGDGAAILICGSTRQGVCELRDVKNIQRPAKRNDILQQSLKHVAVAANSPNASTVSLMDLDGEHLYVAATHSHDSPYRETFPAVATRLISANLAPINSGSIEGEAAVFVRAEYRSRYRIDYVDVFEDDKYIYFASVQPKFVQQQMTNSQSLSNPLVSRLIRICKNDEKYTSYSEIEIQCRSSDGKTNFNILKSVVLLQNNLLAIFTDSVKKNSSICIFQMTKIRLTFFYNIDRCRGGTDSVGLFHIGRDSKCINRSHLPLSEDMCQLGVGGVIEASQIAVNQLPYRLLTSIDARIIENRTLVLIGSNNGEVLQMELIGEHSPQLYQYADYIVKPNSISKVQFINDDQFVVVSNKELLLLRISTCKKESAMLNETFTLPCNKCFSGNSDPLCGWCLHEGRCLRQKQCQTSLLKKCPKAVESIRPENISVSELSKLNSPKVFVPILDLPKPVNDKVNYFCYFGIFKAPANWSAEGLNCSLPKQISHSDLFGNARSLDFVEMPLLIQTPLSRTNIFSQNFKFFNCAFYSVCSMCTASKWPCRWCTSQAKCLNTNEFCGDAADLTKCVKIDMKTQLEVLIPDSTNASLLFSVLNMNENDLRFGNNTNQQLQCNFQLNNVEKNTFVFDYEHKLEKRIRTPALFRNGKVHCSNAYFNYASKSPIFNYTFELTMGHEMIDRSTITVYKCREMADDCSQCLSLDPKWRCTWCDGNCNYFTQCNTQLLNPNSDVSPGNIDLADTLCNNSVIYSFNPKSGPKEGGTIVEINGRDLGSKLSSVENRIYVAGSKCQVIEYVISKRIVCVIDKGVGFGPVRITIGQAGKRTVESSNVFNFFDPIPKSIYPVFGPVSGGTKLTIFGDNLFIGSNTTVYLDNLPCIVLNKIEFADQLICLTSASRQTYTVTTIRIQIDSVVRMLHAKFTYRPDPIVLGIDPSVGFESGGQLITVHGSNFYSILSAKMFLLSSADELSEIVSELSPCQIQNNTELQCTTPKLILPPLLRQSIYGKWPVGFYMDNVKIVRNLKQRVQLSTVPDPQFLAFKGVKLQSLNQPLLIEGNYLSLAARADDFLITIGTEQCVAYLLDEHQLLCRLPEREPAPTDDSGIELDGIYPLVVVRIGSLRVELGLIELDSGYNATFSNGLWRGIKRVYIQIGLAKTILLMVCIMSLVLPIVALLYFFWRRRNTEHERVYKRIQMQIEQMENNVRNECKQAFTELQTDIMTGMTATIEDKDIPYQNRLEFVSKLLFNGDGNESFFNGHGSNGTQRYSSQLSVALVQFDALLWDRQFVFAFVHLVESDSTVTALERTMLSSLLLSALSRNMVYCTDIIFSLLSDHIQKSVFENNSHLLFRRTESMVEKLFQQWLIICLYPYVTNDANGTGRSLFFLYKALKLQTEKGPVDCVTGNARYSLSEQKLLRETIDSSTLTLLVIPLDGFDQAPAICKVLDCDTISQVKSKLLDVLYKNQPFSSRITIDQFDLEWNSTKHGVTLLLDDDRPQVRGRKRLNTVAYYNLPNNCLLTMQSRSSSHLLAFKSDTGTNCSIRNSAHLANTGQKSSPLSATKMGLSFTPGMTSVFDTYYYHLTTPPLNSCWRLSSQPILLNFDSKKLSKKKKKRIFKPLTDNNCGFSSDDAYGSASSRSGVYEFSTNGTSSVSTINIPEVFLTRLLMCKGTVQQYLEEFFDSIMLVNRCVDNVPMVLKFVLDFLDKEALKNNMSDLSILYSWKVNAIILRFWMHLIHNLDCVFNIQRQNFLNSSLIVVGQTLMDIFSISDLALSKDSPSSKLLFAKEITKYRPIARRMFEKIQNAKGFQRTEFNEHIASLSKCMWDGVSKTMTVNELLNWVRANGIGFLNILEQDKIATKHRLNERLRQIIHCSIMEPEHIYATLQ